ncbi:MAG: c-type cytochrome [Caldilineaceae bacterium]
MVRNVSKHTMSFSPNRLAVLVALLIVLIAVLSACQASQPPAAAPAEATTAPAQEEAAAPEATTPAEEEAAAEATAPAEEEAAAEATAPAEEEAAAEATAPAEEEAAAPAEGAMQGDPAAGAYIATLTGGCGCHMNRDLGALAGGNKFEGDFGVAYSSNLTPDQETGIGSWSADAIVAALRLGVDDEGRQLAPAMPYMTFSVMSDQEAYAVAAWLQSLEPVTNVVTETELTGDVAAFAPAVEPPAEPPTDPVARGEELVTLARCGGCHTPKNDDGSAQEGMMLAGAPLRDAFASNITPDEETGIGSWSQEEIAHLLLTGERPDGSKVEGAMAQQIDRRFSKLTEEDAMAIGAYLKSIPAVSNAAPSN